MLNLLGFNFHLYGLLIGLGIVAAVEASEWLAKKRQVNLGTVKQLIWWVIPLGIVGARIYHVVDLWSRYYSVQPIKVLYLWEGGLAIYGAVIGGVIGLIIYYLVALTPGEPVRSPHGRVTSFFDLLDITFIGLPLAQAIGRWGNYFNGELMGRNGEPLFLYESVLDLALFGVLVWIVTGRLFSKPGAIAGIYFLGYGIIRLILEPLRTDTTIWRVGEIPMAQIFSLVAMGIGIFILARKTRPSKS